LFFIRLKFLNRNELNKRSSFAPDSLYLLTDKNLPSRDIHDWQLYGKQFCDMEFICVPEAVILQI
jgi:hypothetical protein